MFFFLANLPKAIRETYEPICMKQPNTVFLHMFDWFIMKYGKTTTEDRKDLFTKVGLVREAMFIVTSLAKTIISRSAIFVVHHKQIGRASTDRNDKMITLSLFVGRVG